MKQQRITMKRHNEYELLRTKSYGDYTSKRPDFGLCDNDLYRYFDISMACCKIDIVLSTREYKDSYAVKQTDTDWIEGRDPADTLWVDEELAAWIGEYAKAAKQEWVYVYFEFPSTPARRLE